ncbi:MAG TPA: glycosyltransferase [Steroidobacteraceae bacterium]|jgi:vancomycin aglycone glucosyltransferase
MAALGARLRELGVDARVCAPPDEDFAELLARAGVPLAPAFTPLLQWLKEALKYAGADIRQRAADVMRGQFDAIGAAAEGCDAIVATGLFPSTAAAQSVAEKLGIRYAYATFCPTWLPSPHHPPLPFPGYPLPADVSDNRKLWDVNIATMNALFGEPLNSHRASIGLPQVDNVRAQVFTDHPWLAADPVLAPWQKPAELSVVQTGAWILPDERRLPAELHRFLEAGPPPVYVGFGSMPLQSWKDAPQIVIKAIRAQGRRAIVARGWAELGLIDDRDDCFGVGEVNQQALFGRVAAVLHHGGAGTTTAATRAGAPQVVVPQIGDQPYWASRVWDLGIGAAHDGPTPTVESLSAALETALTPGIRARAAAVAGSIRIDGTSVAAKLLLAGLSSP